MHCMNLCDSFAFVVSFTLLYIDILHISNCKVTKNYQCINSFYTVFYHISYKEIFLMSKIMLYSWSCACF